MAAAASPALQYFNNLNPATEKEINISPSGKIINNSDGLAPVKSNRKRSTSNNNNNNNVGKPGKTATTKKINNSKATSEKSGTESEGLADATATPSKTKTIRSRSRRSAKPKASKNIKKPDIPPTTAEEDSKTETTKTKKEADETAENDPAKKNLLSLAQIRSRSIESASKIKEPRASTAKIRIKSSQAEVHSGGEKLKSKKSRHRTSKNKNTKVSKSKVQNNKKKDNVKVVKTANLTNPSRTSEKQVEPPFYTSITPEFFSKLKAVANESNSNNIQSKKVEPVKLETLTAMLNAEAERASSTHTSARKIKRKNNNKGKNYTFQKARDALSLGHVPLEANPLKIADSLKKPEDREVVTSWKSGKMRQESNATSLGMASSSVASSINDKKKLRFDDDKGSKAKLAGAASSSNNTRRMSSNMMGGCLK